MPTGGGVAAQVRGARAFGQTRTTLARTRGGRQFARAVGGRRLRAGGL